MAALITEATACAVLGISRISDEHIIDLNDCLIRYNINTTMRKRHFMAQIGHESGGLRWLKELATGWAYDKSVNPRLAAKLGNYFVGDGPKYKGAGVIQLTGGYNYSRFAKEVGDPRIMEGYKYVSEKYPFTSAGFWWKDNNINALVDKGATCRQISARVNGKDPANGLRDREAYFKRAGWWIA